MKQLTSYNRVAGYLNKLFDLLNQRFFESELARPTITIQSTPRASGHFSLRDDAWVSTLGATHEINIGAGTLARPIEAICATFCMRCVITMPTFIPYKIPAVATHTMYVVRSPGEYIPRSESGIYSNYG